MAWFQKKRLKEERQSPDTDGQDSGAGNDAQSEAKDERNGTVTVPGEKCSRHNENPIEEDQSNVGKPGPTGFFSRLKKSLSKTRTVLNTDIEDLFTGKKNVDEDLLEELEELLITSDIGVQTSMDLIERISKQSAAISGADQLTSILKDEIRLLLTQPEQEKAILHSAPRVVMVIGVNGVGKTTTIGKLAAKASAGGQKVLIAAADTFRAAAVEQLAIWAERSGAEIVRHRDGADPAAVAFDGVEAGIAREVDLVLVDTAGRLQTKTNLMEELKKIKRSIGKRMADAPHEVLLVLDATTGQNAISQAALFNEALDITALALTKLDGTAKGGIVISICNSLNIPLKYIGVGENIDDLQAFDSQQFIDALF